MKVTEEYEAFENGILHSIQNILSDKKFLHACKLTLIKYFKENYFINHRFIARTKLKIIELISKILVNICLEEINTLFIEYINNQKSLSDFVSELESENNLVHIKVDSSSANNSLGYEIAFNSLINLSNGNQIEIFTNKSDYFRSLAVKKFIKEKEIYYSKRIKKIISAIDENVNNFINFL